MLNLNLIAMNYDTYGIISIDGSFGKEEERYYENIGTWEYGKTIKELDNKTINNLIMVFQ
jgi:hypothetical protein